MKPNIGIEDKNRQAVIGILNARLADLYVLYTKARNFHWNVVGPDFAELHKFFEAQYEQMNEAIDEVAERARSIGGNAVATLKEFVSMSNIKEDPKEYPDAKTMLKELLEGHEIVIRALREDVDATGEKYHDMGTSDFLTGLMEQHEKMAWMTRSFLENR